MSPRYKILTFSLQSNIIFSSIVVSTTTHSSDSIERIFPPVDTNFEKTDENGSTGISASEKSEHPETIQKSNSSSTETKLLKKSIEKDENTKKSVDEESNERQKSDSCNQPEQLFSRLKFFPNYKLYVKKLSVKPRLKIGCRLKSSTKL